MTARPAFAGIGELGAIAMRDRLAAGSLRAAEVAEAAIARIETTEPDVRAWAFFDPAYVRAQARALDAHRATGRPIGALHGVPVGIKDVIDTAGVPTGNGTALDAGRVPREDAFVVARLKAAGALILGKTATTELAYFAPAPDAEPRGARPHAGRLLGRLGGGGRRRPDAARGRHPDRRLGDPPGGLLRCCRLQADLRRDPAQRHPRAEPEPRHRRRLRRLGARRGADRRGALRPRSARPGDRAGAGAAAPRDGARRAAAAAGLRLREAARLGRGRCRDPRRARRAGGGPRRTVLRRGAAAGLRRGGGRARADQPRRDGEVLPRLRARAGAMRSARRSARRSTPARRCRRATTSPRSTGPKR